MLYGSAQYSGTCTKVGCALRQILSAFYSEQVIGNALQEKGIYSTVLVLDTPIIIWEKDKCKQ